MKDHTMCRVQNIQYVQNKHFFFQFLKRNYDGKKLTGKINENVLLSCTFIWFTYLIISLEQYIQLKLFVIEDVRASASSEMSFSKHLCQLIIIYIKDIT